MNPMRMAAVFLLTSLTVLPAWSADETTASTPPERYTSDQGFVIHEWGVTERNSGVVGNEGLLPDFVYQLDGGKPAEGKVAKKPVIYMYSHDDVRLGLTIELRTGKPFAWWPSAVISSPEKRSPRAPSVAGGVQLRWDGVRVAPTAEAKLNGVEAGHWFETARNPASTLLLVGDEGPAQAEKFLFWEADELACDFNYTAGLNGDKVSMINCCAVFHDVMAVRRDGGRGCIARIGDIDSEEHHKDADVTVRDMPDLQAVGEQALRESLRRGGLYADEADAVVKIWSDRLFNADGTRLIYRMPQAQYNYLFPMETTVKPDHVARVMLVVEELDAK